MTIHRRSFFGAVTQAIEEEYGTAGEELEPYENWRKRNNRRLS